MGDYPPGFCESLDGLTESERFGIEARQ